MAHEETNWNRMTVQQREFCIRMAGFGPTEAFMYSSKDWQELPGRMAGKLIEMAEEAHGGTDTE